MPCLIFPAFVAAVSFSTTSTPTLPPWRVLRSNTDKLPWELNEEATNFANELRDPLLKPEELDQGIQVTRLNSLLPVYDLPVEPFLVTRKDSRGLYDEVLQRMGVLLPGDKSTKKPADTKHALVLGNPGIGKSFGLFYALQRLLRVDKLVFYHYMKKAALFAFVPPSMQSSGDKLGKYQAYSISGSLAVEAAAGSVAQLKNPDSFYLFDPDEHSIPKVVQAHSIIASSPDLERLKDYDKAIGARRFYMPMWSIDEIKVVVDPEHNLFKVDPAVVQTRFDRVGGNLRAIVSATTYGDVCQKQESKINQANSATPLLQAVMETPNLLLSREAANVAESSTLFAYHADAPYTESVVRVMSNYVKQQLLTQRYTFIYQLAAHNPWDWEQFGVAALTCGGQFEVRELLPSNPRRRPPKDAVPVKKDEKKDKFENLVIPPASQVRLQVAKLEDKWADLPFADPTTAPVVYTSLKSSFTLVDAVSFRDRAYNFTINASGNKKLPTAEKVALLLNQLEITEEQPLHLYHCVPDHLFSEWCKSAAPTFPGDDDQMRVGKKIKQYVLHIPKEKK